MPRMAIPSYLAVRLSCMQIFGNIKRLYCLENDMSETCKFILGTLIVFLLGVGGAVLVLAWLCPTCLVY
jgi:hypothetical protein